MPAHVTRKLRKLLGVLAQRDYRAALMRGGVAAAIEHGPLLRSLQFNTVVDIGANRGQFSLVARHCFPDAQIHAFEPLAAPADRFRTVHGHDAAVSLHRVAIGPVASTAAMHVTAEDDSSSLLPVTDLQQSLSAGSKEIGAEQIQIEPLSARLKPEEIVAPALLKIDVQGYELQALEGCQLLLDRFSHLYIECSFVELYEGQALAADVIQFLCRESFQLSGVYNMQYDSRGKAVQADMLFTRAAAVA